MHPQSDYYTISQLTQIIQQVIKDQVLLQDIWVKGELSNFNHHTRGHMYFTMKDGTSKVKGVMFASMNRHLTFTPENGMMVLARGSIDVYERDGQYQLYVRELHPYGMGDLYLAYEQLKQKLQEEGLFAASNKKSLPKYPKRIGVITSQTGAAIKDILTTIKRRYPVANIFLMPVQVQGKMAASSIVEAIDKFNRMKGADVLIIGRGGGSIEELWAFNEETVARSIYHSSIPIISAVGHETDFTIADFVADVRAATPTAAAELAVPNMTDIYYQLGQLSLRLEKAVMNQWRYQHERLLSLQKSNFFRKPDILVEREEQRLDHLLDRLVFYQSRIVANQKERHQHLSGSLMRNHPNSDWLRSQERWAFVHRQLMASMETLRERKHHLFYSAIRQLDALSPLKVLERGYSMVRKGHQPIPSTKQIQLGDIVNVLLKDGNLDCQVYGITESNGSESDADRQASGNGRTIF